MGRRYKLYLETSVWNFLFAEDAVEKQRITKRFFAEIERGRYQIFISDLVITEIADTPQPQRRNQLEELIRTYEPMRLGWTEVIETLTQRYLRAQIVPKKYQEDAIHIAYAVAAGLDGVVSWNLKHIVKLKTKIMVNQINHSMGHPEIEIVTPEEVIEYEN